MSELHLQHQFFQRIFRTDFRLDLLAIQRTLRSLSQHHSSKASILRRSAFFIVQLSHPYMTTGKTIALTGQTFVGKVISLLFNKLSSKKQASFNFMAAVTTCSDFGASQNKVCHVATISPSICHEVMGLDATILVF